jgi:hypothetical protein
MPEVLENRVEKCIWKGVRERDIFKLKAYCERNNINFNENIMMKDFIPCRTCDGYSKTCSLYEMMRNKITINITKNYKLNGNLNDP